MKKALFIFATLYCAFNFQACSSDDKDKWDFLTYEELHGEILGYCETYFSSVVTLVELQSQCTYECSIEVSDKSQADKILENFTNEFNQLIKRKSYTYQPKDYDRYIISWDIPHSISLHVKYEDSVLHITVDMVDSSLVDRVH